MQFINIHDAKTNLSKYLERVAQTHDTIVICKNGKPLAQLTEFISNKPRKLGGWAGKVIIHSDFDELPDDFIRHFS